MTRLLVLNIIIFLRKIRFLEFSNIDCEKVDDYIIAYPKSYAEGNLIYPNCWCIKRNELNWKKYNKDKRHMVIIKDQEIFVLSIGKINFSCFDKKNHAMSYLKLKQKCSKGVIQKIAFNQNWLMYLKYSLANVACIGTIIYAISSLNIYDPDFIGNCAVVMSFGGLLIFYITLMITDSLSDLKNILILFAFWLASSLASSMLEKDVYIDQNIDIIGETNEINSFTIRDDDLIKFKKLYIKYESKNDEVDEIIGNFDKKEWEVSKKMFYDLSSEVLKDKTTSELHFSELVDMSPIGLKFLSKDNIESLLYHAVSNDKKKEIEYILNGKNEFSGFYYILAINDAYFKKDKTLFNKMIYSDYFTIDENIIYLNKKII